MSLLDDIRRDLDEIISHKETITEETNAGVFNNLTFLIGKLDERVREYIQQSTTEHAIEVINRLDTEEPLSSEDLDLIRLWIIGDAEHYVRMESDRQDWLTELNRLIGVIGEIRGEELTVDNAGRISGAIRDATRVIGDIVYFKGQEERIARFDEAINRLESADKRMISGVLKDKLRSSRM